LSTRFVERVSAHAAVRIAIVAAAALAAGACGSSTPRVAASAPPAVVAPAGAEQNARAASSAVAEPRSSRRERRDDDAPIDPAAAGLPAPSPEPAQLAYDRALAALRSQDWLRAEGELQQLAREYPAYPGPHVNLAILYLQQDRRDDARAALDRALAADPGNPAANNQLGIWLRGEGKFEDAERAYRRALESAPNYALAHYNLAVLLDVYLRRGAEAIEHYEAYQSSRGEPDKTVAGWIIDLRRRFGGAASPSQVAKENGA
jgi:tetratricopeptide (TPR) repeat protein